MFRTTVGVGLEVLTAKETDIVVGKVFAGVVSMQQVAAPPRYQKETEVEPDGPVMTGKLTTENEV